MSQGRRQGGGMVPLQTIWPPLASPIFRKFKIVKGGIVIIWPSYKNLQPPRPHPGFFPGAVPVSAALPCWKYGKKVT